MIKCNQWKTKGPKLNMKNIFLLRNSFMMRRDLFSTEFAIRKIRFTYRQVSHPQNERNILNTFYVVT